MQQIIVNLLLKILQSTNKNIKKNMYSIYFSCVKTKLQYADPLAQIYFSLLKNFIYNLFITKLISFLHHVSIFLAFLLYI